MSGVRFAGFGKYLPERRLTNQQLSEMVDTSDQWIRERTGIAERRIAAEGENTSDMAVKAAQEAISQAGIEGKDIDLVIVATSSPDYLTPPVSSQIQAQLGATHAGAFTIVVGCAGFVYALIIADQFVRSGMYKNVMLIGVELITRMIDWTDRNTCVLFGDAAGAVLMQPTDDSRGLLSHVMGSDGNGFQSLIIPAGGVAMWPTADNIAKKLNSLKMNGPEVFKFATRVVGKSLDEALTKANLTVEEIDLFIPHQANLRIIEAAAHHMRIPREKIIVNVDKYGNTSAASIPLGLHEAHERGLLKPGANIAMVAFGAGLSWAAAIARV